MQVEYGESASEVVGDAIMVVIHLINLLEVNELVLYARSSNIEQSTLFTELYFEKHEANASAAMKLHGTVDHFAQVSVNVTTASTSS